MKNYKITTENTPNLSVGMLVKTTNKDGEKVFPITQFKLYEDSSIVATLGKVDELDYGQREWLIGLNDEIWWSESKWKLVK